MHQMPSGGSDLTALLRISIKLRSLNTRPTSPRNAWCGQQLGYKQANCRIIGRPIAETSSTMAEAVNSGLTGPAQASAVPNAGLCGRD